MNAISPFAVTALLDPFAPHNRVAVLALLGITEDDLAPFRITGPACISFSGGRTSAFMLFLILLAHHGRLPADVVVCFANTGDEMPGTLDFVRDVGAWLNVHINWLELLYEPPSLVEVARRLEALAPRFAKILATARDPEVAVKRIERLTKAAWRNPLGYRVVSHNSASRNRQPLEMVIQHRGFLFNTRQIFCSGETKTRTVHRFLRAEYGWTEWTQVIGLRADYPDANRVVKARIRAEKDREYHGVTFPLHDAGLTKQHVAAFFRAAPVDLRLKGAWEGNCRGCVRKRRSAIARMFRDHPEDMAWWPAMEARMRGKTNSPLGAVFRKDWGSYAAVRDAEMGQGRLDLDPDDDGIDVMVECDGPIGCGT